MISATTVLADPPAPVQDAVSPAPDTVSVQELAQKIDHIAALLAELKAQVQTLAASGQKPLMFGDLYGIFAGRMDVSEEDLAASRLGFQDEWLEEADAPARVAVAAGE